MITGVVVAVIVVAIFETGIGLGLFIVWLTERKGRKGK